jgi:hypothetical protein
LFQDKERRMNPADNSPVPISEDAMERKSNGGRRWPAFDRVYRQASRFERAAERMDVDIARAARDQSGATIAEARRRCLACVEEAACARWLDAPDGGGGHPGGCANARFFRRFRLEAAASSPPFRRSPDANAGT